MNETTILLSPSPGDPKVKPDFLATVEPLLPRQTPFTMPFELVLDGYTREPWSSGKSNTNNGDNEQQQQQQNNNSSSNEWKSCYLISTDGRNRLPGFLKYLQGRKKAALAKFKSSDDSLPPSSASSSSGGGRAMLVVPFDPPPIPPEDLPSGVDKSQVVFVKYLRDEHILLNDDAKKKQQQKLQQQKLQHQKMQQQKLQQEKHQQMMQRKQMMEQKKSHSQQPQRKTQAPAARSASPNKRKGGMKSGLLGNLLGAQRRTENHLHVVRSNKTTAADLANFDPTAGAAGCINNFRTKISEDLEKFKTDSNTFVTKINIDIGALQKTVPADEVEKVTMDVFKFTVYEQVEEVGMDKWIAAKEPSEFMDECVIAVYKEGHCPPEILEDMNKGELPDEIKGQQKHLMEAQAKAMERKGKKHDEAMVKASLRSQDVTRELNTNKRDRRTLEQIQMDMQGGESEKRGRYD